MSLARFLIMGRKHYSEPLVTVVRLSGVLATPMGRGGPAGRTIYEQKVERYFQRAFHKPLKPAAVAVVINSPGGSAVQSDLIYRLIRRLRQQTGIPVHTFAEDVAASGGYWLMTAGDKLHALEGSIVGSVGVISASFGAVDALARLGLERRVYTAGEAKAQLDPFKPVQPEQVARLQDIMADLHDTFKQRVRESRGDKLNGSDGELFSGRAWTGRQALKLGLIDALGDYRSTMLEQFGDKTRFLLCSPPPPTGPFAGLLGGQEARRAALASPLLPGGGDPREVSGGSGGLLRSVLGCGSGGMSSEAAYDVVRTGVEAAMDVADERALWARFNAEM